MKVFYKISLFFNAFLFMNLVFLGKEIYLYTMEDQHKNCFAISGIVMLSAFILIGLLGFIFVTRKPKGVAVRAKVIKKKNTTGNYYFGYFSLFVLLFMSFSFDNLLSLAAFAVVLIALAVVYCRNDLFYINPTILFLGMRTYSLQVCKNTDGKTEEVNVITREEISIGSEYIFYSTAYEFTTCEKDLGIKE